eukprot:jgi/Bigna1/61427/fgenesh1_kg.22_\
MSAPILRSIRTIAQRRFISTRSAVKGHDNPPVFDTKAGFNPVVVGSISAGCFVGGCLTTKFAVWFAQKKAGKV